MRRDIRRFVDILVGVAFAALLVLGLARPAAAYPPGTSLTLTANKLHVTSSETAIFTANFAKPYTSVKFTYGSSSKTVMANGSGVAVVSLKTPGTGMWVARAVNLTESATTTVYAPKISLTKSTSKPGTTNSVKVQFVQPGTVLTVMIGNTSYYSSGAGTGTVTINFVTPPKGRYNVLVYVSTQLFATLRLDSK